MGSKKEVLRLRSVSNIVIAPARTGMARRIKSIVMATDHTNRGILSYVIPAARILMAVEMKFTAPRMELAPARWSEKIPRSTAEPL